jgi:hypothetical protein
MWLGAIANLENERVIEKLSDVILVYVCCLLLFFWLLLADSTHLTAVWCTFPYSMTLLAVQRPADAGKRRSFSQSHSQSEATLRRSR